MHSVRVWSGVGQLTGGACGVAEADGAGGRGAPHSAAANAKDRTTSGAGGDPGVRRDDGVTLCPRSCAGGDAEGVCSLSRSYDESRQRPRTEVKRGGGSRRRDSTKHFVVRAEPPTTTGPSQAELPPPRDREGQSPEGTSTSSTNDRFDRRRGLDRLDQRGISVSSARRPGAPGRSGAPPRRRCPCGSASGTFRCRTWRTRG